MHEAPWTIGTGGEATGLASPCGVVAGSGEAVCAGVDAAEDAGRIEQGGIVPEVINGRIGRIFGVEIKFAALNGLNGSRWAVRVLCRWPGGDGAHFRVLERWAAGMRRIGSAVCGRRSALSRGLRVGNRVCRNRECCNASVASEKGFGGIGRGSGRKEEGARVSERPLRWTAKQALQIEAPARLLRAAGATRVRPWPGRRAVRTRRAG